ncbi:SUKH-4 family immunity protein [Streptomyces globosus]|uniref:SUKH-4 family immunity protein n=1 Tax=Streptomyces globosus TaxID=68209 RepID=UPI0031D5422A
MVTFAQAQERAEEWINGGVPPYQHREVRVREFGLGFVVWAEDRAGGPVAGGGRQRLVIARDGGEVTLWPGLPVGEVIRRYEEEYGAAAVQAAEPSVPAPRIDSEQTSFMLSPPEWLQEAADRAGIPPAPAAAAAEEAAPVAERAPAAPPAEAAPASADDLAGASSGASAPAAAAEVPEPVPLRREVPYEPTAEGGVPVGATPWAGTDVTPGADDASVPLPATVFAPPLSGSDLDDAGAAPSASSEARTQLMPAGSALPKTAIAPALDLGGAPPVPPAAPAAPPGSPEALAQEPTGKAPVAPPAPPSAPGAPGAGQPPAPPGPPGAPGSLGRGLDHAATMLAGPAVVGGPPAPPGPPPAPGAQPPLPPAAPGGPGTPPGGVEHAATMLAGPAVVAGPSAPPAAPAATGTPTVGPGYQAVLRYRGNDGSEQQIIRRSAPGTPHPEWQILHELRAMNVPPQQVLELHTELESCELPGGYCARMIRETWPQVRITSVAPYGKDHAGRQAGMRHLLTHQGELHQVADGPARPAPVRAPLPQVPLQPAIPLDAIGAELAGAFGPQGVFRFDQRAVSRQGVPDIVAQTLMWAGLPTDFGPFFWAQAVPGQPVPTLAELAVQRQVQPASDAGSYLVIGSDFGKALCVQYGTAHIVAVPVEGGPGGAPVPPQFVNSSLPQFARSIAMLGHMWRLRQHLTPEQAGRWTVDFQANLAGLDSAALTSPESWWSVLLEQMWDGLL